jgi:hypothetical protein
VDTQRGLFEGPEWDEYRSHIEPDSPRFDEAFRFIGASIAVDPYENSSTFWDDDDWRVMVTISYPGAPETWIYYHVEDEHNVELLWIIQPRGWLPPMLH